MFLNNEDFKRMPITAPSKIPVQFGLLDIRTKKNEAKSHPDDPDMTVQIALNQTLPATHAWERKTHPVRFNVFRRVAQFVTRIVREWRGKAEDQKKAPLVLLNTSKEWFLNDVIDALSTDPSLTAEQFKQKLMEALNQNNLKPPADKLNQRYGDEDGHAFWHNVKQAIVHAIHHGRLTDVKVDNGRRSLTIYSPDDKPLKRSK